MTKTCKKTNIVSMCYEVTYAIIVHDNVRQQNEHIHQCGWCDVAISRMWAVHSIYWNRICERCNQSIVCFAHPRSCEFCCRLPRLKNLVDSRTTFHSLSHNQCENWRSLETLSPIENAQRTHILCKCWVRPSKSIFTNWSIKKSHSRNKPMLINPTTAFINFRFSHSIRIESSNLRWNETQRVATHDF